MARRIISNPLPPEVRELKERGIASVIPLLRGKAPGYADWQSLGEEEVQKKFWGWKERPVNYGIRLGRTYGKLCDIDLDSKEARALAPRFLRPTARFGRGGNTTHYLYRIAEGKAESSFVTRKLQWDKRDEKSVVLEIRYSGQTMGPGSTHPDTGELIEWQDKNTAIAEVSATDLSEEVFKLAAAAVILREWVEGKRDDLALALCGVMVRSGWGTDQASEFLSAICIAAGDEQGEKRLKAERIASVLASGGHIPGKPRLKELMGEAAFDKVMEWLDLGGGSLVDEMNQEYAVVSGNLGVAILREEKRSGEWQLISQDSFGLLHKNKFVRRGDKITTADKVWITSPDRREYLGGIVFKPEWNGREPVDGEYNLWRGFAVEEVPGVWGEGWELYAELLRDVLCGGIEEHYHWILAWMAQRVQRPWEVPRSSIVMVGSRGTGKGTVASLFGKLFGRHYGQVTNPRHFLGNFNSHLIDKVLVFADEAVWGGDKVNEGILKVMISEDKRILERKGKDAYEVENCTAYLIASNQDWVVPVGFHERRFMILRIGDQRMGDRTWFAAMRAQMEGGSGGEGGGLGRLLYDLKRMDFSGVRLDKPPVTGELAAQMVKGLGSIHSFLHEWIVEGCGSGDSGSGIKLPDIEISKLHAEFILWCKDRRKWSEGMIEFSKVVHRVFPLTKIRSRITIKLKHQGSVSTRPWVLRFPEEYRLTDALNDFSRELGMDPGKI